MSLISSDRRHSPSAPFPISFRVDTWYTWWTEFSLELNFNSFRSLEAAGLCEDFILM